MPRAAALVLLALLFSACGKGHGAIPELPESPSVQGYARIVEQQAALNHVPPGLIAAIIAVESGGNPHATSHSGNLGLMQLKPSTAAHYGVTNLYDPIENITAGARFLHDLLVRFRNNVPFAVAAYNAGPAAVAAVEGIPASSRAYVSRVMGLYSTICEGVTSKRC